MAVGWSNDGSVDCGCGVNMITIELAGTPIGKGRPKFVRRTGHAFTPEKTRNYETNLRLAAQDAMGGAEPFSGPLIVLVEALFPVPQSWSRKKREAALAGSLRPTSRPDWENVAKVCDGLNEIVWRDDSQIVDGRVIKSYSARPALRIEVTEIGGA